MLRDSLLLLLAASSSWVVLVEAWVVVSRTPSPCRRASSTTGAVDARSSSKIFKKRDIVMTTTALNMVESIALDSESSLLFGNTNHEQIGQEMAESVQRWLDAEWIPQDIHMKMGQSCKRSYIKCRAELNTDDLMTIMMQVAQDLEEHWNRDGYSKDAFVNAWDVANYVSDYLTAKSGIQGCECNTKIH